MEKEKKSASVKKKVLIATGIISAVVVAVCGLLATLAAVPFKGKEKTDVWDKSRDLTDGECITLYKETDKNFRILNITDVHFTAFDSAGHRKRTKKYIQSLIDESKPDLITVTGDNAWLFGTKLAIVYFADMMESFDIPWAPIFGNHDSEQGTDRLWIADVFMKRKNCLMKKGPKNIDGVGNYIINIKEKGTEKIVHTIFMMDAHDHGDYSAMPKTLTAGTADAKEIKINATGEVWLEKDGYMYRPSKNEDGNIIKNGDGKTVYEPVCREYDFIKNNQIEWYKWAVDGVTKLNGNAKPKSTLMFHIPLPEYAIANEEYLYNAENHLLENGKIVGDEKLFEFEKANPLRVDGYFTSNVGDFGGFRERVCAPYYNSGFFDVIKKCGSTEHIIVGHDHYNNSSVMYDGIRLSYALKTGNGCDFVESGEVSGGSEIVIDNEGNYGFRHIYKTFSER